MLCRSNFSIAAEISLNRKTLFWSAFALLVVVMGVIQFIPSAPVIVPSLLPPEQRNSHRVVNFEGIANFRDLGGYQTADGRQTRWGLMYRSGNFSTATRSDNVVLASLGLEALVDFRSAAEKEEEPHQLPDPLPFKLVEIPTMDGGDHSVADEIMARVDSGDFADFDPDAFMITANRLFARNFTPQFSEFIQVVLEAKGRPVAWNCSAGKDRTGFAAAILLRILGVPMETVLDDYALSKQYSLAARQRELTLLRLFKGDEAAEKLSVLLGAEKPWLEAAFDEIDKQYGSFDVYVEQALGLAPAQVKQLRHSLLE
jgi:protein-tyrosine phosphatase